MDVNPKDVFCEDGKGYILASKLISELVILIAQHGDLNVFIESDGYEWATGALFRDQDEARLKLYPNDFILQQRIVIT